MINSSEDYLIGHCDTNYIKIKYTSSVTFKCNLAQITGVNVIQQTILTKYPSVDFYLTPLTSFSYFTKTSRERVCSVWWIFEACSNDKWNYLQTVRLYVSSFKCILDLFWESNITTDCSMNSMYLIELIVTLA